jgi:hypothetical protein
MATLDRRESGWREGGWRRRFRLRAVCTLVAVVKFSARLATSGSSLACFTSTVSRSANLDTNHRRARAIKSAPPAHHHIFGNSCPVPPEKAQLRGYHRQISEECKRQNPGTRVAAWGKEGKGTYCRTLVSASSTGRGTVSGSREQTASSVGTSSGTTLFRMLQR